MVYGEELLSTLNVRANDANPDSERASGANPHARGHVNAARSQEFLIRARVDGVRRARERVRVRSIHARARGRELQLRGATHRNS